MPHSMTDCAAMIFNRATVSRFRFRKTGFYVLSPQEVKLSGCHQRRSRRAKTKANDYIF